MKNIDGNSRHTKSELGSGVWFSPGYYAGYWENCINRLFTPEQIINRVELKQHREVWVGSIFAAAQSLGGTKNFVGLPTREPPDIEIIQFHEVKGPKNTPSQRLVRIPMEITRCNIEAGETLIEQIRRKNKKAYENMNLLVYCYGGKNVSDYETLYQSLKQEGEVYSKSIFIVEKVARTAHGIALADGTFVISCVYPTRGQSTVNISDSKAFFRYEEVIKLKGRYTGLKSDDLGYYELLPPNLKNKKGN